MYWDHYSSNIFPDPTSSLLVKIVGWKGKMSVRAYVLRNDRLHYLRLIGADISSCETNKFKEKKEREQEREAAKAAEVNKMEEKDDIQPDK